MLLALERWVNRRAGRVIANARAVAEAARMAEGASLPDVEVIPNALDMARIDAIPPGDIRSAFPELAGCDRIAINVAHLLPHKGHENLLRAWKKVLGRFPRAGLLVVGRDDGGGGRLVKMRDELGLKGRVCFAGGRRDVIALVKGADFAVHASTDEGMPNAVLEYMACGRPIIATRAGGTGEALGDTGVLVGPGEEAIAAGILGLLDDGEAAARMGQRARERATAAFTVERMVKAHEEVYTNSR